MFKKLLSTVAAASIIASALSGFTLVSAEGNVNVTDCNIENGSENTNTSAIVLTFDGNVNSTDLSNAVKITDAAGTSCQFTVTSKDNKAQIGIVGAAKNTTYTMSVDAGADVGDGTLAEAFTRSFTTGNTIYTSSWSTLGNNSERINDTGKWGGKFTDTANGIKLTGEVLIDYPLESAASEGIIEVSYERYIPSYTTDANGASTETETSFPQYGISDKVCLDNGKTAQFFSIHDSARITKDAWHTYRYVIDIPNKTYKFYLDGKLKSLDTNPDLTDASYVSKITFQAGGGGSYNREMWVRNVRTVRRNDPGSWAANSYLTESDGIATITVPNNAPVVGGVLQQVIAENYYVLKTPISSRAKISFEYKANESTKASDKASEYGTTSIRFYPGSGSSGTATTVCYPFNYPKINYWTSPNVTFNLPNGVTELAADAWHKAEYVFDFDTTNSKRVLKYVTIDGEETLCNFEVGGTALGNVSFFIKKRASGDDNVLQVKNINVIENYSSGDITATPSFGSNAEDVVPSDVKLTFSAPIATESVASFALYDENGVAIDTSLYSFSLDSTYKVLSLTMDNYELSKTYIINTTAAVNGYLGGTLTGWGDGISFKTPAYETLAGTWKGSEVSVNNGIATITVKNNASVVDGVLQEAIAEDYYVLNDPITSRTKIGFEYKANDIMKASDKASNYGTTSIRFYQSNGSGSTPISVCYPFNYPKIAYWDSAKSVIFNLPSGVTELAADTWHKVEYVFDFDTVNDKRILKYVTVDGKETLCNFEVGGAALGSIAFFTKKRATGDDNVLQVKNFTVSRNYSVADNIAVTSSFVNGGTNINPNEITLSFSAPISKDAVSLFALYDEDGEAIDKSLYSFSLDSTYKVMSLTMDNYDLNKTYNINITDTVNGHLGGSISAIEGGEGLYFTTPTAESITGKWSRSYNNANIESSITAENGVTTFNVQNIGKAEEGKDQTSREGYAYAFTAPVTGTNVPLTVKYKFRANEALSLSESTMRFYPYEHADKGGTCICVDFPYKKPQFRWDGIKFNLPDTTIAPNEWHEVEYAFNVDSTNGTTMLYAIVDGVITFTNYKKAATKQLQSIDLFFYGTDNSTDDFKLEIKDMAITKAASEFDVTASNKELTPENNKIQVNFVSPVSEDNMKAGIKVLSGTTEVTGAITGYAISADGLSAVLTIGGLNTTGDYTLSFASLQDCYGRTPKTQKFSFTYTAPKQEGIVEITGGSQTVTDNTVTVKAVLSNGTFSVVNGKLIVAAYNKTTNKLVGMDIVDVTDLAAGATNVEKTAEFTKPDGEYTIKAMLWDNLANMEAISDSYPIN